MRKGVKDKNVKRFKKLTNNNKMIYFLLLFVLSVNAEKFCINCKYFKQSLLSHPDFAKCHIFPKKLSNQIDYLVSGSAKIEYYYCSTAREYKNMCGQDGKYYKKKWALMDNQKNQTP